MSAKLRTPLEKARVAERLALDPEPLQPIHELKAVAGISPKAIERWIRRGRSGVFLDGIKDPMQGWLPTVSAIRRAHRDRAAALSPKEGGVT